MAEIIRDIDEFLSSNRSFFQYLKELTDNLKPISMEEIVKSAGGPENVAIICVDMIEGFCRIGPLASDRIEKTIGPVVSVFKKAHNLGVRNIAISYDRHTENTPEFSAFPPHCRAGSEESKVISEITNLPFYNEMLEIPKNSIASNIDTQLESWIVSKMPKKIIITGDCTDLCTYQLAMFIRTLANARGYDWEVIVPENAVQTYDMPVDTAKSIGAVPHPGNLMHLIFLYHMKLNGITVVSEIS